MDKTLHNSFSHGVSEAPAIPGLVFRHLHGAVDLPGIAEVMNASFAADGNSERITVEGLARIYAHPVHWDPQQDTLLVEVQRALVGCAHTAWCEEAEATAVPGALAFARACRDASVVVFYVTNRDKDAEVFIMARCEAKRW